MHGHEHFPTRPVGRSLPIAFIAELLKASAYPGTTWSANIASVASSACREWTPEHEKRGMDLSFRHLREHLTGEAGKQEVKKTTGEGNARVLVQAEAAEETLANN